MFGLGNKQYEHFCAVGKRVQSAMESLGATPVVERGDGDDDEDIEADFETWKGKLVAALDNNDLIYKPSSLGKVTPPPKPQGYFLPFAHSFSKYVWTGDGH